MKFLNKFSRERDTEDEDGLDPEDNGGAAPDSSGGAPGRSRSLLTKALSWRNRGRANDQDLDEDPDGDPGESPPDNDDPSVTLARPEGVADVRPVEPAVGAMTPSEAGTNAAPAAGSEGPPGAAAGGQTPAEPPVTAAAAPGAMDDGEESDDLDLTLRGIFEEKAEVNEILKYLADSQDDVAAADLASDLRELLSELRK